MLERAWTALGEAPAVIAATRQLEQAFAGSADFQVLKALVCRATGSPSAARDAVARALSLDPEHAYAKRLSAEV
jgi:hypothetical protein